MSAVPPIVANSPVLNKIPCGKFMKFGPDAKVIVLKITVPEPAVLSHNLSVPLVCELTTIPYRVPGADFTAADADMFEYLQLSTCAICFPLPILVNFKLLIL